MHASGAVGVHQGGWPYFKLRNVDDIQTVPVPLPVPCDVRAGPRATQVPHAGTPHDSKPCVTLAHKPRTTFTVWVHVGPSLNKGTMTLVHSTPESASMNRRAWPRPRHVKYRSVNCPRGQLFGEAACWGRKVQRASAVVCTEVEVQTIKKSMAVWR